MEAKPQRHQALDWRRCSVTLTSRCNLFCRMCHVVRSERASLTRAQAFSIVDFAAQRGFRSIALNGGEPTILPYFWDLLERLGETPLEVELLTNAYRLTDDQIGRLARQPNLLVHVSVDGVGAVHDAIRAKGSFEATDRSVRRLLDAGGRVSITTTVQRSNFRAMIEVYEWFKECPLAWHAFNFADPFWGDLELIPTENLDEALGILRTICERDCALRGRVTLTEDTLRNFSLWLRYPLLKLHPGRGCTIPLRHVAVGETGVVRPCWHFGWHTGPERNINTRPLDAIVDEPGYAAEVHRGIGRGGCRGCSAMCYQWDEDFRTKLTRPTGVLRLRRAVLHAKEYLRLRHPWVFNAVRKGAASLHR